MVRRAPLTPVSPYEKLDLDFSIQRAKLQPSDAHEETDWHLALRCHGKITKVCVRIPANERSIAMSLNLIPPG